MGGLLRGGKETMKKVVASGLYDGCSEDAPACLGDGVVVFDAFETVDPARVQIGTQKKHAQDRAAVEHRPSFFDAILH
jgi:hypothetical protein